MKKIFLILILISIFSYSKNEKTGVLQSSSRLLKEELEKKYSEYGIDLKNEKEELALINNKKFTVELADILIERAVSLGKNDLIPIIKNNIKERGN